MTNRCALAFILLLSGGMLHAADRAERDVRVTVIQGTVTLKMAGHHKRQVLDTGMIPLSSGDLLETGPRSEAEIVMDGNAVFKLLAGSRFKIKKASVKNTQLDVRGVLLAKVRSVLPADNIQVMKLPTALVAFRGSEFAVQTSPGLSHVGVFHTGQIVVAGSWGHERVVLGPNKETMVPLSNVPGVPHRLVRMQKFNDQMPEVRRRAVYWHRHWVPMSLQRRQDIRDRLAAEQKRSAKTRT